MNQKTCLSAVLLPAALLLAACAVRPAGAPATAASSAMAPAPAPALPPGVQRVLFGTSYKPRSATGVPRCGIREPLPDPPTFAAGVREVAWIALVDTAVVKDLRGTVIGAPGGEFAMEPCEIYTVCGSGEACRAQYGAVLRRRDGKALRPGTYRLEIEVAGEKVTLPFEAAGTPALEAAPPDPPPASVAAAGASAAAAPDLPPGVRQVLFGPPFRHGGSTGAGYCRIKDPLPAPPRFGAGVREIAWTALVEPGEVADLRGQVTGDAGGELQAVRCDAMRTCPTGTCRSQYGAVLRRKDGEPLRPGIYRLEIEAAGRTTTLPFEIAAPAAGSR